jgi:glycosyltransferase involved in cell wall biosynthesis
MKIFAFHLLNDYSGSPKVLMQLVNGWNKHNLDVHLVTCKNRNGFLSNLNKVTYHYFWYQWAKNPVLRFINLTISQLILITSLWSKINKQDIIYINTVLPFGAGILGKLKGCRVIYHIHETTINPAIFKQMVFGIAKWSSSEVIFVSKFLALQEPFKNKTTHILYNAIENSFLETASKNRNLTKYPSHVLMVCSLKDYKGVKEFVLLAQANLNFNFRLVLNASKKEIDQYFKHLDSPSNLQFFDTQTNLHSFYQWADVILNLSRPHQWVETFGLTIIEGMAYGIPAIVPPVGGITELVEENTNGFKVDSRKSHLLHERLNQLFTQGHKYEEMIQYNMEKINSFSENAFIQKNINIISVN